MSLYLPYLVISEQTRPMAVPAERRLQAPEVRTFGSARIAYDIPDLTKIQTESYARFLQYDGTTTINRKDDGLESVLREIFPIETIRLHAIPH